MLTPREVEVIQAMADGATAEQAAESLFMAPSTVKAHLTHARKKLKVLNTPHLVATCLRTGLIQ